MHAQFQVHMLNDEGKRRAVLIAEAVDTCLTTLESLCVEGREMALVRTKMEEACFFSKKSVAGRYSVES